MARPLAVAVDDEAALLQYLPTITEVAALIPASRMGTRLPPKFDTTLPRLLVQRIAGQASGAPGVDEPVTQLDVVGGKRSECKRAILTVRAAILAIANDRVAAGVLVSAYEEIGPAWLPDTLSDPPVSRYVARYRLTTHC